MAILTLTEKTVILNLDRPRGASYDKGDLNRYDLPERIGVNGEEIQNK
jgi:hypothetical protein